MEGAGKGKLLFQKNNCISCHQIFGLGGYMGPDLTNVISAPGKGELYAKSFIKNGTQRMPNFNFTDEEADALIAYLKQVDAAGISPVVDFKTDRLGLIHQQTTK